MKCEFTQNQRASGQHSNVEGKIDICANLIQECGAEVIYQYCGSSLLFFSHGWRKACYLDKPGEHICQVKDPVTEKKNTAETHLYVKSRQ